MDTIQLLIYEALLKKYAGLIANSDGIFIKESLLPSSRNAIKEAFFKMTEYVLKQKDINWGTIYLYIETYSRLPDFIKDDLAEKYNMVWGKWQGNPDQFKKDNPDITMEFVKLKGKVVDKSLMLHKEILNYIGTFEQGKKFKGDEFKLAMISEFKNHFIDWVIGDIERASKGGAKAGAFILAACAFDYLAGFMVGGKTNGNDYVNFIQRFVCSIDSRYEAEALYTSLRCGLVHNYTIKGSKYSLTDANPLLHLTPNKDDHSQKMLNLEDFIDTLKKACVKYFEAVSKDEALQKNLDNYINTIGFLGSVPVVFWHSNPQDSTELLTRGDTPQPPA